jgi:hypothetical protein
MSKTDLHGEEDLMYDPGPDEEQLLLLRADPPALRTAAWLAVSSALVRTVSLPRVIGLLVAPRLMK